MKLFKDWFSLLTIHDRIGLAVIIFLLIAAISDAKGATLISEESIDEWCNYYQYEDCSLVKSIIWHESAFNPGVHNSEKTGSYGLMQIQCSTAKMVGLKYGCDQLFDPQINVRFGILYLRWLEKNRPIKSVQDLIAAYNAGTPIVCKNKNYNKKGKLLCYPGEYINHAYLFGARGVWREYTYRKSGEKP